MGKPQQESSINSTALTASGQSECPNQEETLDAKSADAHSRSGESIAAELRVSINSGLSSDEARARLLQNGPNSLTVANPDEWWRVLLRQFSSIVVWLLITASITAWFTSGIAESAAILVVLVLNAFIGFIIEWRAGQALEALRKTTPTNAKAKRDGNDKIVNAVELVVGDIISLAAGDRVPADARLLESVNLQTDESTLTGESTPVSKSIHSVSLSSVLPERSSMLYLGTMVVGGRAVAIVTATGAQTELGQVSQLLAKTQSEKTPLERRLAAMGKMLVYVVFCIAAVILLAGFLRGEDPALMFEVSISLAVAAVPEALPAMTTLILALGVLRMARRRAIVRRLSAVEALGSTTVICADKTGTLTENRMRVIEYRLSDGASVDPNKIGTAGTILSRLLRASILCNDAVYQLDNTGSNWLGDPTETALLTAAEHIGLNVAAERSSFQKLREYPFDTATKRMIAILRERSSGDLIAASKGAPGVILDICTHFLGSGCERLPMDKDARLQFIAVNEEMAGRGLRVLGFAEKIMFDEDEEDESGYTFLGFSAMADPPRYGVKEAVRSAHEAGIRVTMLTGDQVTTAKAIARELGLGRDGTVCSVHASEIAGLTGSSLALASSKADVFARVSPEDKLRIVESLQNAGEIVAVTGDGINDAPALKRANIGIAMGLRGTDVAKEAADVILTDDNFTTIVSAIEGGRTIYANIIKFVHLMFSHNLAEVLFIFAAIITGLPLPLHALQILWLNLVTDVFPAFGLAVEPASRMSMQRRPRPPGETLLSNRFLMLIGAQGTMLAALALGAYVWALQQYGEGDHARSVALLALTSVQFGHTFNCRSRTRSAFYGFFENPFLFAGLGMVVLLQIAAFSIEPLSRLLRLAQPNFNDLLVVLACAVIPILIVEVSKWLFNKRVELYDAQSHRSSEIHPQFPQR